jgi:hypothetical protein
MIKQRLVLVLFLWCSLTGTRSTSCFAALDFTSVLASKFYSSGVKSKINESWSWSATHSKPSFMPFKMPSKKLPNLKDPVGNCSGSELNVTGFPIPLVSMKVTLDLLDVAVAKAMTWLCKSKALCMSTIGSAGRQTYAVLAQLNVASFPIPLVSTRVTLDMLDVAVAKVTMTWLCKSKALCMSAIRCAGRQTYAELLQPGSFDPTALNSAIAIARLEEL